MGILNSNFCLANQNKNIDPSLSLTKTKWLFLVEFVQLHQSSIVKKKNYYLRKSLCLYIFEKFVDFYGLNELWKGRIAQKIFFFSIFWK